jgi:hypothetical protein
MPQRDKALQEGYRIFYAITSVGQGYENASLLLEEKIKEAEKDYDITFLSGPSFKEDPASREIYFVAQGAVLHIKKHHKEKV